MQRVILCLIPLAILSACATPRERCVYDARAPLYEVERRIDTAGGNIARGYAIAEVSDVRFVTETCLGYRRDGRRFGYPCTRPRRITREEPVAIDVGEERRKLAELRQARAGLARSSAAAVQQCVAVYPE